MLRRLFLLLVAAVSCALASAAPVGAASTTIAEAVPGVYDAPVTTRGAIQGLGDLTNASSQPAGSQERSAARSVTTQGQSTTPHSRSVATNTARLNLPFRDAGLRSQVDDVVRHFDDFGAPPPGVAQGGLKGHPTGTYGGQGLPQKSLGYYTESDVWISGGGVKRGAERLVFGQGGEVYYTPTHYDDFVRIR